MIGIDTNVLVRFLTRDDPAQAAAAEAFMATLTPAVPGFVAREVMVELVWVLERAYRRPRAEIAAALEALLEARELVVEAPDRTARALLRYRAGGAGLADQMILLAGADAGCTATVTFDARAAAAPGGRLLATP